MDVCDVTTATGAKFEAKVGESMLDAALRNGVVLPYSCRTGRCSTCKCKVSTGETVALHPELGLSEDEKKDGWILSCVRGAITDVALDVEDLGDTELFPAKTLPSRIESMDLLADDVVKVMLRLPPTADFRFNAGQYLDVIGPNGVRRSYSIASGTVHEQKLELHIRRVPDGELSDYWFTKAKANDLLRLNGPLGTFFLRDVTGLDLVFLATGTGIAPVKAMLEGLRDTPAHKMPKSITVYWGGRVYSDLYWTPPPMDFELRYLPTLSRAHDGWDGARGYVHHVCLATSNNLQNAAVYACGSDAMIQSAHRELTAAGLPENRFYSDAFVCSSKT